jgi:hypothetical protein
MSTGTGAPIERGGLVPTVKLMVGRGRAAVPGLVDVGFDDPGRVVPTRVVKAGLVVLAPRAPVVGDAADGPFVVADDAVVDVVFGPVVLGPVVLGSVVTMIGGAVVVARVVVDGGSVVVVGGSVVVVVVGGSVVVVVDGGSVVVVVDGGSVVGLAPVAI